MENSDHTAILKRFVKDRYCVPEGMNLVMISNGKVEKNLKVLEDNFYII